MLIMNHLHFSIDIKAPKEKVWHTMLDDKTYRQWTGDFNPSGESYYEGSWEEGSNIRFLGPDSDGKISGISAKVVTNRQYEFVSTEIIAEIHDGKEDPTSEISKKSKGGHENYTFTEKDGVTTIEVDTEAPDELMQMFEDSWPKGLAKIKKLAEGE
jgi:uncharacterized protein YndB with AHSA1/START domain